MKEDIKKTSDIPSVCDEDLCSMISSLTLTGCFLEKDKDDCQQLATVKKEIKVANVEVLSASDDDVSFTKSIKENDSILNAFENLNISDSNDLLNSAKSEKLGGMGGTEESDKDETSQDKKMIDEKLENNSNNNVPTDFSGSDSNEDNEVAVCKKGNKEDGGKKELSFEIGKSLLELKGKSNEKSIIGLKSNHQDSLKTKIIDYSSDSSAESSDENDEVNYLARGPLVEHRNNRHRFTPLPNQVAQFSNDWNLLNILEGEEIKPTSGNNDFDGYYNNGVLSPHFAENELPSNFTSYGKNALADPFNNNEFNFYNSGLPSPEEYSTSAQMQKEFSNGCLSPQATGIPENSSFDFSQVGLECYSPLSPPLSVSSTLKDGHDGNMSFENVGGSYDVFEGPKESEDLISIINNLNETSTAGPNQMPTSEVVKLRTVLEGEDDDSIRSEMGMYLKDEQVPFSTFQKSDSFNNNTQNFLAVSDNQNDFTLSFEGPLTPPKSVSPVQDEFHHSSSFSSNEDFDPDFGTRFNNIGQSNDVQLTDILNGIQEIVPDELNIYLNDNETNIMRPSLVKTAFLNRCKPCVMDHAVRRLSSVPSKILCKPDEDGDTCLMIVYSKPEDSPAFYENIFCLQEKMMEMRLCCGQPLGKGKKCKICGNSNSSKFYTPLSMFNKQGDSALTCALKRSHSTIVVDFLLSGIAQNECDRQRIFSGSQKTQLGEYFSRYPSLYLACQ